MGDFYFIVPGFVGFLHWNAEGMVLPKPATV